MSGGPLLVPSAAASGLPPAVVDRVQLARHTHALVDRLRDAGVTAGDRIGLAADNSPQFVVAMLALMELDVCVVLLDPATDADRLVERCRQAEVTRLVVTTRPWRSRAVPLLVLTALPDTPSTTAVPEPTDRATAPDPAAWWRRTDALIVFSSGTTGAPTAVLRSGPSVAENLRRTHERMGYRTDDVLLPLLPFSHQYGLSMVLLWWSTGCSLVTMPPAALTVAVGLIESAGVTVVDATPATYVSLLRWATRPVGLTAGRVRLWCVGGSPLGPAVQAAFTAAVGRPLLDGYGSSELGNIALAGPDDPRACGRPLSGLRIEIVDEQGRAVPAGVTGGIVVHSPDRLVAARAVGEPWRPVPEQGYHTGDLGSLDEQGRLTVIGRAEAVHRLGHTLYPEALARRAEAAGVPVAVLTSEDDRVGSRLTFVVADPDRTASAHWRSRITAVLDSHEWPNQVLVVDAFPTGPTGKVDRAALREQVAASLGRRAPEPRDRPVDPFAGRRRALLRVADHLADRPEEVLRTLTTVVSHRCAQAELSAAISTLRGAAAEVDRYRPMTVPQAAVFMPSNIPLYAYVLYLLVPSLYTEQVVFRPSSHIRDACVALHEQLAAVHGLGEAVHLSRQTQREFVTGPVAQSGLVVFTGTYANAEKVRAGLRRDQLMLFFGQGVNPFVVGPDADLELAAADAVTIRMINNGQDCFGPDVVLVDDRVADRFVGLLRERLTELRFGDYLDPVADYGPLLYDQALGAALLHLHRMADSIVHGGAVDLRQRRLEPTVLRRPLSDKLVCDELFAPIFNIVTYPDEGALHEVLRSPFFAERAMGAMVYGTSERTVALLSERHHVCVDTTLLADDDGNEPFGGLGIRANYTAIDGRRRAEPLLLSKAVADHLGRRSGHRSAVSA